MRKKIKVFIFLFFLVIADKSAYKNATKTKILNQEQSSNTDEKKDPEVSQPDQPSKEAEPSADNTENNNTPQEPSSPPQQPSESKPDIPNLEIPDEGSVSDQQARMSSSSKPPTKIVLPHNSRPQSVAEKPPSSHQLPQTHPLPPIPPQPPNPFTLPRADTLPPPSDHQENTPKSQEEDKISRLRKTPIPPAREDTDPSVYRPGGSTFTVPKSPFATNMMPEVPSETDRLNDSQSDPREFEEGRMVNRIRKKDFVQVGMFEKKIPVNRTRLEKVTSRAMRRRPRGKIGHQLRGMNDYREKLLDRINELERELLDEKGKNMFVKSSKLTKQEMKSMSGRTPELIQMRDEDYHHFWFKSHEQKTVKMRKKIN